MNPIWAFIKTTRPINLLIIAVTMICMRHFVEGGLIHHLEHNEALSNQNITFYRTSTFHFSLLTLIMLLLAASGNLINDYFDVKVDRINKPNRITVGKYLKRRVAMISHHSMNIIAVMLGFYIGWAEKEWFYAFIPLLIASSLWFYSFYLKKTFLLGNILVALVVCIVPIWATYTVFTQTGYLGIGKNSGIYPTIHLFTALIIMCYTIQAYAVSLLREIVKDAEDIKGDSEYNYRTLPVVWGLTKTRNIILVTMFFWVIILVTIMYYIMTKNIPIQSWVFCGLIVVPFLISAFSIMKKDIKKNHFSRSSFWLKITLAGGLVYCAVIPQLIGYIIYNF